MTPPHTSKSSTEKGSILFFVLLAMSLIAFMIRRVHLQTSTYLRLTLEHREGLNVQNSLRERIASPSSPARGCQEQTISIDEGSRRVAVCSTGLNEFTTAPPTAVPSGRIDYNLIFKGAKRCPGLRRDTEKRTFDSPRAASDCILDATLDHGGIFVDNLAAEDLSLGIADGPETLTIATPGCLTVTGTLTTNSSLLILGGGDISIANISSKRSDPARVTIVSAHGSIVVQKTSGNVSLLTLGRALISVPPTPFLPPFPLPPFRASLPVTGIIPTFRG